MRDDLANLYAQVNLDNLAEIVSRHGVSYKFRRAITRSVPAMACGANCRSRAVTEVGRIEGERSSVSDSVCTGTVSSSTTVGSLITSLRDSLFDLPHGQGRPPN